MSTRAKTSETRSIPAMETPGASERQATQPTKVAPGSRWQLQQEAGWALGSSAPMQKHLRPVLGDLDKSTVSRMCSGEKASPVSKFYELVREVVREGRTNAGHLIAGAMVVAEEEALHLPSDEIRRRLLEALAQESFAQASEDIAQHALAVALGDGTNLRGALEAYDEAVRHETGSHVDTLIYARALMTLRGWRAAP